MKPPLRPVNGVSMSGSTLPFVTIVMPALDEERYIASAIASVLPDEDAGIDYEVIVADGGSVDATAKIVRMLAREGAATLGMTAAQLMTSSLVTVTPGTTVAEAMTLMSANRVRHLPVLQDGALAGLVSIGAVALDRFRQGSGVRT